MFPPLSRVWRSQGACPAVPIGVSPPQGCVPNDRKASFQCVVQEGDESPFHPGGFHIAKGFGHEGEHQQSLPTIEMVGDAGRRSKAAEFVSISERVGRAQFAALQEHAVAVKGRVLEIQTDP